MKELMSEKVEVPKGLLWMLAGMSPVSVLIFILWFGGHIKESDIHQSDADKHMKYIDKVKEFVPRTEVQYKLEVLRIEVSNNGDDLRDIKKAMKIKD